MRCAETRDTCCVAGAFRAYPKLKTSEDKFEYGYRLKEFPDDPVKTATKEKTELTTNPIMQWYRRPAPQ
jgi:hypothetical protein